MKKQAELLAAIDEALGPKRPTVDVHGLLTDIVKAAVPTLGAPGEVRAKGILRDRIAAMINDNSEFDITPAEVRDVLGDMVDTLLDSGGVVAGGGISVTPNADGTVTVATGGAAGASGLPSYLAVNQAYVSADTRITADVMGIDPVPLSILYLFAPSPMPRDAGNAVLSLNGGADHTLVDISGNIIAPRLIEPGRLLQGILNPTGGFFRLVEPLEVRPQDFPIVMAFGHIPSGESTPLPFSIVESQLAAGVSSMGSTLDYPAGETSESFIWFGVPLDAPDLDARVQNLAGGLSATFNIARLTIYDGVMFNGTGMKLWWTHTGNRFNAGDTFRFSFVPY